MLTALDLELVGSRYGAPYIVMHRHDLLEVILRHCRKEPNLALETSKNVTTVSDLGDHVAVTCEDGSTYRSEVLIGADGLNSTVRPLVVDDELQPTGDVAYRGAVPLELVERHCDLDAVVVWIGPGMHFVQYPLRRGELYNQVAVFRSEAYRQGEQDWGTPEELDRSARLFGGRGLLPLGAREQGRRHSPLLVYRREDTDAAPDALLAERGGPMVGLEYVNPTSGGPALPTMSCELHRLVPRGRTTPVRRVGSSVVVVYQGAGTSVINGQRFEWSTGDMFVIPSWAVVDHQASEPTDLFVITDRPVMEAFGLYREMTLDSAQEVTSRFTPDEDLSGPGRWS
jgi:hypothetical protein